MLTQLITLLLGSAQNIWAGVWSQLDEQLGRGWGIFQGLRGPKYLWRARVGEKKPESISIIQNFTFIKPSLIRMG